MKLVDLSVARPVTLSMGIAILLLLGGISLKRLPIDLFPAISKPVLRLTTPVPGFGPTEVEQLVTSPLETAVGTTSNLMQLTSSSVEGMSEIRLAFRWNTNLDAAIMDLRQHLDDVRGSLPMEAERTEIERFDPTAGAVLVLHVAGPMNADELRIHAEDELSPQLDRVSGVAAVQVAGGAKRELRVEVDPQRLAELGLRLEDIAAAIGREHVVEPSGRLDEGRRELLVRTVAELDTVERIEQLNLLTGDGSVLPLGRIATVSEGLEERRELSRLNGSESVQLKIFKDNQASTLEVVAAVKKQLDELPGRRGVNIEIAYDQSTYIVDALALVRTNAWLGAMMAALVLLVFLRDIRSALIVSVAMPVSVVVSLAPLSFAGVSLNIFSLAGLALALGLVVDNSIVILENIFRHLGEGKKARVAAVDGAKEVEGAVLASTTTTLAVFLPILLVSGMAGQVFRDLALAVAFVLAISELVAITLIPMAASRLFRRTAPLVAQELVDDERHESEESAKEGRARIILRRLLDTLASTPNRRFAFLGAMAVIFLATLALLPPAELFPSGAQREFSMSVIAPAGLALDEADQVLKRLEAVVGDEELVEATSTEVGFRRGLVTGDIVVRFTQAMAVDEAIDRLRELANATVPAGHLVEVAAISPLDDILKDGRDAGSFGDIVFQVEGEDLDLLEATTSRVRSEMDAIDAIAETGDSIPPRRPEISVLLDRTRAADLGLDARTVSDAIGSALTGRVATTIVDKGRRIDIRVVSHDAEEATIDDLGQLPIVLEGGGSENARTVPLVRVATIERRQAPAEIQRFERQRVLYASARLAEGRATGEALPLLTNQDGSGTIDRIELAEDMRIRLGGAAKIMVESFDQLAYALGLAILLVYMIMAAQFESLIHPFVVMFSVPLSLIGATIGLRVGSEQLSITAFIGLIVLVGIAVNDAILLVSTTNQLREQGMDRWQAVLTATSRRLRPIMMTTLTTIFGMIPLAWGLGPGSEFYEPLALVVIFGLAFATFLTLVVIPAVYLAVDDVGDLLSFAALRLRMSFYRPPGATQ